MTILIVEDEETVANIWQRFLAPLSDDIRIAPTLNEAFKQMARLPPPDLILLDLRLPGSESAEGTLQNIRKLKAVNPEAVVLVLTGATDAHLPILAVQLGADGFKQKTSVAGQEGLLRTIQGILQKRASSPDVPAYARSLELYERLTALLPPVSVPTP